MKIHQLMPLVQMTLESRLLSRDLADDIFNKLRINLSTNIEVDFSGIEFISRTFADQFHKNKVSLYEIERIEIVVVNCNESVFNMLQEVARTNDDAFRRVFKNTTYNVSTIKSRKDLRNLNLSF